MQGILLVNCHQDVPGPFVTTQAELKWGNNYKTGVLYLFVKCRYVSQRSFRLSGKTLCFFDVLTMCARTLQVYLYDTFNIDAQMSRLCGFVDQQNHLSGFELLFRYSVYVNQGMREWSYYNFLNSREVLINFRKSHYTHYEVSAG